MSPPWIPVISQCNPTDVTDGSRHVLGITRATICSWTRRLWATNLQKVQPAIPISLSPYGSACTVNTAYGVHSAQCTQYTMSWSPQRAFFS